MLKATLLVGCGGFFGSSLRYLLTTASNRFIPLASFPIGTLVVNALGCFCIGLLFGTVGTNSSSQFARFFLMIGLLGGFTTFSAFGLETVVMLRKAQYLPALTNILLQNGVGILAAVLGIGLTK
jgi:CrcB protein